MRIWRGQIVRYEDPALLRVLEDHQHDVLLRECGRGEQDAATGNDSPDVLRYRAGDGTGGKIRTRGAWCATLRSYGLVVACAEYKFRVPIQTTRGAREYTRRVADCGRWIVAPGQPLPPLDELAEMVPRGATACLRSDRGPWQGHVTGWHDVVLDSSKPIRTLEGNANNRVDASGRKYAVVDLHRRSWEYWAARVYGISTLAPE